MRGLAGILVCFVCCGAPAVAVRIMDSVMQIRPKSIDVSKWTDVSIHADQIVIKGGCNSKGELADSIQYKDADGVTHQFVALHKNAMWFLKGAGGTKKGDLKAVTVLEMLRLKTCADDLVPVIVSSDHLPDPAVAGVVDRAVAVVANPAVAGAVAGSDSQTITTDTIDDDDDPMASMIGLEAVAESLDGLVKDSATAKPKREQVRKKRKLSRASVQELTVPLRPACIGHNTGEETTIVVYNKVEKKNMVLCLRTDCINWLLSYAADELACQGVSCGDASSASTPQKSNGHAEHVYLEWNFQLKRWEASFIAGPAQGEMIHFGLKDVTPALCKKLRQLGIVNCWYNKSCTSTLKNVAKVYIVLLCKATNNERLDEHNAEFEQLLVVGSAHAGDDATDSVGSAHVGDGGVDSDSAEGGAVCLEDGHSDGEQLVPGEISATNP